jgi:hypothetical protein
MVQDSYKTWFVSYNAWLNIRIFVTLTDILVVIACFVVVFVYRDTMKNHVVLCEGKKRDGR